jgi:hypothetical protein
MMSGIISMPRFCDELGLELLGDRTVNRTTQRGRDADVAVELPEVAGRDRLSAAVAQHRAAQVRRVLVHVAGERGGVDPVGIGDGAVGVLNAHAHGPHLAQNLRGAAPHVAEALHDEARAFQGFLASGVPLLDAVRDPLPGRLHATARAADAHVLPRHDTSHRVSLAFAVGVLPKQPRHDLPVRPDVRRRDVDVRADQLLELVHVAEGDALELVLRERARVHLDAALAATERHVCDRRLPRHLGGEDVEEIERHVLMKP